MGYSGGRDRGRGNGRLKLPFNVKAYTVGGKAYFYFRGTKARLPGLPWSPEFMAEHARLMAARQAPGPIAIGAKRTVAGTVNAAIAAYYSSAHFGTTLAKSSQVAQRTLVERFRKDFGDLPMRGMRTVHLQKYVSAQKTPAAQKNMLRALKHFLTFTAANGLTDGNPADGVTRAKLKKSTGFYAWTEDDVGKFEARHPIGTQARLALALYLNLGVRKSDVVRIGPRLIKDGELIDFLPQKTSHSDGKLITVPLFAETKAIIAATPLVGSDTYLVTAFGKPFTANGFGNKMREWCDQAGLPECSSHGLRKLCLIRLAEAGFSAPQIAAISGHKDLREVQTYIDAANRKSMARDVVAVLEARKANK